MTREKTKISREDKLDIANVFKNAQKYYNREPTEENLRILENLRKKMQEAEVDSEPEVDDQELEVEEKRVIFKRPVVRGRVSFEMADKIVKMLLEASETIPFYQGRLAQPGGRKRIPRPKD